MTDILTQIVVLIGLPTLLAYAAFSDLFSMRISNRVCLAVLMLFGVFAVTAALPMSVIAWHLAAGFVVLAVAFLLFSFNWIGGGDAKLVAAASVWFGFGLLWEYIAISAVLGGLLTLSILFARTFPLPLPLIRVGWIAKLHDRQTGVPYGIALSIAGVLLLPASDIWKALV
jgi:prepilin peptidase CpaA